MTYLELINKVLVRLRQATVASLSDPGAALVGHFVNQAKEEIEDIGPWKALRAEGLITTVAGTSTSTITGITTTERSYIHSEKGCPQVFETTSASLRRRIQVIDYDTMTGLHEDNTSPTTQGRPEYVAFNKTASGLIPRFFPIPDAVYTFKPVVVNPQAVLAVTSTALTIPSRPVWMLAVAYYAQERGEELSGEPGGLMAQARIAIDNAMLADFGGEEQTFYVD